MQRGALFVSRAKGADFLSVEQRTEDFTSFCRFVKEEYAYFALKKTDITVRVPTEKLFHIDGTPREAFVPCAIPPANPATLVQDQELSFAIDLALRMSSARSNLSIKRACPGMQGHVSHFKR